MLGLGSIVGTGVFVSLGIGAGIAGSMVLPALVLAGLVAACNGLSSAQLAAAHPVSGGTYEYGYRFAHPVVGFTAGWMFLCAKGASAATAALGFAGYVLSAIGSDPHGVLVPLALGCVVVLTGVTLTGMKRSSQVNTTVVAMTLVTLGLFVALGASRAADGWRAGFGEEAAGWPAFFQAAALMFVAYTGYGRIATLGEEVRDPRRTIPKAIVATLGVTVLLYASVCAVGVGVAGPQFFAAATLVRAAPLEVIAQRLDIPILPPLLAIGAVTAMAGVLLNLLLGLSRVVLAMGRRGDAPAVFGKVGERQIPVPATLLVGAGIAGLVAIGSVKTTWMFSAFTVLVYYAITNFCALRLPPENRLYPRWISVVGLGACLSLAFFVEPSVWLPGLGLIGVGLVWHALRRRRETAGT